MPAHPVPPPVVALLTSSGFHQDAASMGYLLGIFSGYTAPRFPATRAKFFVYVSLTDGHGPTPLTVRLVDGADDGAPPLWARDLAPTFYGPLDMKETAVEVPPVTLPRPGVYRWQVVCNGAVIHERRLPVAATN